MYFGESATNFDILAAESYPNSERPPDCRTNEISGIISEMHALSPKWAGKRNISLRDVMANLEELVDHTSSQNIPVQVPFHLVPTDDCWPCRGQFHQK